jgi:hypothetical protein
MALVQSAARFAVSKVSFVSGEFIVSPMKTPAGMDITTTQPATSKQLDIFLKENVFFISGDILLFLRLFLTTRNSLQLINNIAGMTRIQIITRRCTWSDITKSFTDITFKIIWTMISIARRVKSLPFVTDVR